MTHANTLTQRYLLLRAEMRRRLADKQQWATLPGLLDEMHRVRIQQRLGHELQRSLNA
jgi:hypothetical protein